MATNNNRNPQVSGLPDLSEQIDAVLRQAGEMAWQTQQHIISGKAGGKIPEYGILAGLVQPLKEAIDV